MNCFILTLISIFVGLVIGAIDTLFGRVLLAIGDIRNANLLYFIPFLAVAGLLIVFCYTKFGGKSSKGMGQIFAVAHGEDNEIPMMLVPLVMCGTWITHLCGGSAGREGVAVQIGATVSHWIGSKLKIENAAQIMLTTGMAAGFAGLFGTPMAAVAFALEVIHIGKIRYNAILPAVFAAFTAAATSAYLGLEKFEVVINESHKIEPALFGKLVVLGIAFGLAGLLFTELLKYFKGKFASLIPSSYKRIAYIGIALSIVLYFLYSGRYCGLGTNLISAGLMGQEVFAWDWLLKLVFTVITLAAGFQGGEVTPLFSIGVSLGTILATLLGMPVQLAAALGYISVFGSATNTFWAPVLIGVEVFGGANAASYFIVCAVAFAINRNKSIYGAQKVSI